MDESLKKFNRLPQHFKDQLSGPDFLGVIDQLEQRHQVKLALAFVKLVVNDLNPQALKDYLAQQAMSEAVLEETSQTLLDLYAKVVKQPTPMAAAESVNIPQPIARFNALGSQSTESIDAFTKKDEQEIASFDDQAAQQTTIDYDKMAAEIIAQFGYNKQDAVMIKRLTNIIIARLKDIRDRLETRENLKKSLTLGGLEFSDQQADELLTLTHQYASQLQKYQRTSQPKETIKFPVPKPIKPITSLQTKIKQSKESLQHKLDNLKTKVKSKVPIKKMAETPTASQPQPVKQLPKIVEEDGLPTIRMEDDLMIKPKVLEVVPKPTGPSPVAKPYPPKKLNKKAVPPKLAMDSTKPTVDGIKFTKQLVGPVEELGRMTLIDFRRLGETAQDMTDYIREKISLLEQESYAKRLEGIQAWQSNEVNKFYRLLGQASMAQNKSVEGVIDERVKAGKPSLSWDEFQAVMELNKELRF